MGWDRRGYYYRASKQGGRVLREYIGAGEVAQLIARMDALEREKRELKRYDRRAKQAKLEALDAPLNELDDLADLLARAALLAAGFHRHNRGEWRKWREQDHPTG